VTHLLSALCSLSIGLVLVVVPWWPQWLWDANVLVDHWPLLRRLVLSPFLRGAVTGLGLVNVLLAFQEVREHFAER
jgi:hypothetical protein